MRWKKPRVFAPEFSHVLRVDMMFAHREAAGALLSCLVFLAMLHGTALIGSGTRAVRTSQRIQMRRDFLMFGVQTLDVRLLF